MRNQKGITLIALIVTIIVLIIIAGISIATLTADNGILRQVDSAKVAQIEGNAREQVNLSVAALRLAIAEAQAKDNSYKAIANAKKIQTTLVNTLEADNTVLNGTWSGTDAEDNTATFTVKYVGDDYTNACNQEASIVYTITLAQSSIEITDVVATGITGATGADGNKINPITVNDIKN